MLKIKVQQCNKTSVIHFNQMEGQMSYCKVLKEHFVVMALARNVSGNIQNDYLKKIIPFGISLMNLKLQLIAFNLGALKYYFASAFL